MYKKKKTALSVINLLLVLFLSLPSLSEALPVLDGFSVVHAQDPKTEEALSPENDSTPALQWNHRMMNIEQAWEDGYTGQGVTIAILDTGFYHRHPDLNMAGGYSVFPDDAWSNDHSGHGTHIAGIIGAQPDSTYRGIAPEANLFGIKIYHEKDIDENGYVSTDVNSVIKGIRQAIDIEADIIVISSGLTFHDEDLYEIIQEAYRKDILIIAASGNGSTSVDYPANYPEVVAVTAFDERLHPALDIIYGNENEFAAPGVNIGGLSIPDSTYSYPYIYMSGSSQAAPHVAGIAAILMQKYETKGQELREIMQRQAINIGDPGLYGYGLLRYVSRESAEETQTSSNQSEEATETVEETTDSVEETEEMEELPVRKPSSSREADTPDEDEEEELEMSDYYQTDALEDEEGAVLGYDVLPVVNNGGTLEINMGSLTLLSLVEEQVSEFRERNITLILSKDDVSWKIPPANFIPGNATLRFYEGVPTGVESQTGDVTSIYTTSIYQKGARHFIYPSWMEITFNLEKQQANLDAAELEGYAWDKREKEWFQTILEGDEGELVVSTRHATAVGVFNPDEIIEEADQDIEVQDDADENQTDASGISALSTQIGLGVLLFFVLLFGIKKLIRKK